MADAPTTAPLRDANAPAAPPPPPEAAAAAPVSAAEHTLPEVLATASAWALAVLRHLDPRSRLNLARASRGCWLWALQSSPRLTASLLAHSGLSEPAWQARFAAVRQALADRGVAAGPGATAGSSKIVLRVPTPHPAALQAVLSLSPAGGSAVTEVEVCQNSYSVPGMSQDTAAPWPNPPAPLCATLHTLTLKHMCAPLPEPSLMPSLRVLHAHLWGKADDEAALRRAVSARCASIGRFLPQLTAVGVYTHSMGRLRVPWDTILSSATHTTTLTTLTTTSSNVDEMLPLIVQHAPNVQRLSCYARELDPEMSADEWGVGELVCVDSSSAILADNLATWPQSPNGLRLVQEGGGAMRMKFFVDGPQGLSAEVQQRLPQWKFSAPVRAHLHVPTDLSQAEAQTALQAALSQLSVLPPGTEVYLNDDAVDADWSDMYPAAVAAIAATTHTTQHLSIVLPACYGVAELYFSMLDSPHGQQRASRHVRLSGLKLSPAHAAIPWPWESVRVGSVGLSDLLLFPDPTGGQYEVTLDTLDVRTWEEWTPDMCSRLQQRLQHMTFVTTDQTHIILYTQDGAQDQPAGLRRHLQLLRNFRWRQGSEDDRVRVTLSGLWSLTPTLLAELSKLPVLIAAKLDFSDGCIWLPAHSLYEQLAGLVPSCYSEYSVRAGVGSDGVQRCTAEHLIAICTGASARGGECEKLVVCVWSRVDHMTDEQRTQLEACIDERGLGRWVVPVQWIVY